MVKIGEIIDELARSKERRLFTYQNVDSYMTTPSQETYSPQRLKIPGASPALNNPVDIKTQKNTNNLKTIMFCFLENLLNNEETM
ncbi:hypothetical protein BpHYR1_012565 [Brachionus plicatilis]|uniref:Uncharacterized protein n=1 Tax=Brachionus plicatilis TaxID=10195 RepID=A0A3M7PJ68_BRAPC|nr:hypothetical protein BpHYR1_012565 [Brachionus plicatilis]